MNYEQLVEAIAQYKSEGQDLGAVIAAAQSMAGGGKTPLGLNQWQRSDKPVMDDFNEDNRIIDEEIRNMRKALAEQSDAIAALRAELSRKVHITTEQAYPTETVTSFGDLPGGFCRVYGTMDDAPETTFNGHVFTYNDGFGMISQTAANIQGKRYFREGDLRKGEWYAWKRLVEAGELSRKVHITTEQAYPTETVTSFGDLPGGFCRVYGTMDDAPETTFNGHVFTYNDGFGMISQTAANIQGKRYFREGDLRKGEWYAWKRLVEAGELKG